MRRMLAGALALSLLACSSYTEIACSDAGCKHGLNVFFSGAHQPGPWTVEVSAAGQAPRTFSCDAGVHCGPAFYENFLPSKVTVRVTANGKTEQHTDLTPTLRIVRPNGPQCTPECQQLDVSVLPPQP
jgi:hypothetical protein